MTKLFNKYSRTYDAIIAMAQRRNFTTRKEAKKQLGYVEKHHIIPRCIGGTDDDSNLVFLTAKEHFVCHHLLTKMYDTEDISRQMRFALNKMSRKSSTQQRVRITARMFDKIRKDFANDMSVMNTGRVNGPMSRHQKMVRSVKTKGVPKSDQAKQNMRGPKSESHLKNIRTAAAKRRGVPLSEERIKKLRKPKKEGTSEKLSRMRQGQVSAYDLIDKKIIRVDKTEFERLKNVRYVGQKSKRRYDHG